MPFVISATGYLVAHDIILGNILESDMKELQNLVFMDGATQAGSEVTDHAERFDSVEAAKMAAAKRGYCYACIAEVSENYAFRGEYLEAKFVTWILRPEHGWIEIGIDCSRKSSDLWIIG